MASYLTPDLPEGWITDKERAVLEKYASRSTRILEIGSWRGKSTLAMAQANPSALVVSVDPHDTMGGRLPASWSSFLASLANRDTPNVAVFRMLSTSFVHLGLGGFDMAFIDGDHSYEAVREDLEIVSRLGQRHMVVALHDYKEASYPGVQRAIEESSLKWLETADKLWVGSR
jgi:predicted O-methyltransferase YrrM